MTSLPKGVQFKQVKPQGVFQEYRDYTVTPIQTYSNQFSANDIIRIQFNLQDWYIDPYESYIETELRLTDETPFSTVDSIGGPIAYNNNKTPIFYMMDGPSTSLINDYRLEVNSKEIERIREYDQVGNILTDLNMYPQSVDQKDFEGYYSIKGDRTVIEHTTEPAQFMETSQVSATNYSFSMSSGNTCLHNSEIAVAPVFNTGKIINEPTANILGVPGKFTSEFQTAAAGLSLLSDTTLANSNLEGGLNVGSSANFTKMQQSLPSTALAATRSSYNYILLANTFPGTSSGYTGEMYGEGTVLNNLTIANTNYGIFANKSLEFLDNNPCQVSPKLNQIDGHNTILTNMATTKIVNGEFQSSDQFYYRQENVNKLQSSRAYLQIPLLSGVMGVLIPQDRWELIPSSSLGQVNMEFRINEHAFISHDGTEPQWNIAMFQLRLRMYRFDSILNNQLKETVNNGIQLHSEIFSLGPIYNIAPNVPVTNNWELNNGIPSIKQLFFWFVSNDYQLYNEARKNFRLSHNITSIQLKVGSTYIPQNPIVGHAGNIVMNPTIKVDNSVFLSELQQSMNMLFDCKKHININKLNFAVNDRPYDVTCLSFLGEDASTTATTGVSAVTLQQLKHYGYFLNEELRCRGKALFTFNMEMDKSNDDTMTGMNTTKIRPIELIIKADDSSGNVYSRQSTMYTMFLSDFIVTFNGMETSTEGAG